MAGADEVRDVILAGGANGFSSFMGYYMLEALAKSGNYDEAMKMISEYWGAMLDLGATTFWEDFDYSKVAGAGRIDEIVPEAEVRHPRRRRCLLLCRSASQFLPRLGLWTYHLAEFPCAWRRTGRTRIQEGQDQSSSWFFGMGGRLLSYTLRPDHRLAQEIR